MKNIKQKIAQLLENRKQSIRLTKGKAKIKPSLYWQQIGRDFKNNS